MEHNERRAKPRLPRGSRAAVTTWNTMTWAHRSDLGQHMVTPCSECPTSIQVVTHAVHHGITDGNTTIEFESLHAARMAAFIHNTQNGN